MLLNSFSSSQLTTYYSTPSKASIKSLFQLCVHFCILLQIRYGIVSGEYFPSKHLTAYYSSNSVSPTDSRCFKWSFKFQKYAYLNSISYKIDAFSLKFRQLVNENVVYIIVAAVSIDIQASPEHNANLLPRSILMKKKQNIVLRIEREH
jgi:hypothetical protein